MPRAELELRAAFEKECKEYLEHDPETDRYGAVLQNGRPESCKLIVDATIPQPMCHE